MLPAELLISGLEEEKELRKSKSTDVKLLCRILHFALPVLPLSPKVSLFAFKNTNAQTSACSVKHTHVKHIYKRH